MKTKWFVVWFGVVMVSLLLSGCGSVRFVSTLKPSENKELRIASARFCLANFSYATDKKYPGEMNRPEPALIYARAKALYPHIFVDDWSALPVSVAIFSSVDTSGYNTAAMIAGFSLGIIPMNGKTPYAFTITATVDDAQGGRLHEKQSGFEIASIEWGSIWPYGLIPAPGPSDLPREHFSMSGEYLVKSRDKIYRYAADCIAASVVQGLLTADQALLAAAYHKRQTLQQELVLDGKSYQGFLAMNPAAKNSPAQCRLLVYAGTPSRVTKPVEDIVVARQDDAGAWHPVNGYLRSGKNLHVAGVLLQNGLPSKVVVRPVEVPPLADFIDTPDFNTPERNEILRWNNGVLLAAKNRSLESVLREESRDGLLGLVTRIEQAILDLNEKAEQAKDRAQSMVEKAQGDPASERELAVLCRQRIEILKPILGALKQQAALRTN